MGESTLRQALRWLAHPASIAAVAVMAVNDHVLKQAFGTWWTGKLSDVAGLVFFPAVVAIVLAASARIARGSARTTDPDFSRLVLIATAVTGIGFVWVKASVLGAATASGVLSAVAGPSIVRADETDLLALPALGVAVWMGIGAARVAGGVAAAGREAPRAGRARKALTVAALPLALLASIATGEPEDAEALIAVDDDGQWLAVAGDQFRYTSYYEYTVSGWQEVDFDDPEDGTAPVVYPRAAQTEDCVPSDPDTCYRAMVDALGVEVSADGGDTWDVAWELSRSQVRTLETAYGVRPERFATTGVGVVEMRGRYVVIAANGTDGYALRDTDGTWERIGFEGLGCCDDIPTVDFATVDDLPEVHAYPVGYAMGLGLPMLALPFLAFALRRGRRSSYHPSVWVLGAVLYLGGAGLAVAILAANWRYGVLDRTGVGVDAWLWIPGVIAAVMGIVGGLAAFGLLRRGAVLATVAGWVMGSLAVGIAAEAARGGLWWQLGIGLAVLGALYALYVPFARRAWVRYVPREKAVGYQVALYRLAQYPGGPYAVQPYPVPYAGQPYPVPPHPGGAYPVAPDQVLPYPVVPYPVMPPPVTSSPVMPPAPEAVPPPVMPPAPAAVPPPPAPPPEQEHRGNP